MKYLCLLFITFFIISLCFPLYSQTNDNAIILRDETEITLFKDGSSIKKIHKTVKILKEEGSEEATVSIYYDSLNEKAELLLGRTIGPDGNIVQIDPQAVTIQSVYYEYTLYNKMDILKFSLPNAVKGAIFEYIVQIKKDKNDFQNPFFFESYLNDYSPMRYKSYSVTIPESERLIYWTSSKGMAPKIYKKNGAKTYVWEWKNIKKIKDESFIPPYELISERLVFGLYDKWEEIGKDYINKISPLTPPSLQGERDIKDIYYWISENIECLDIDMFSSNRLPNPPNVTLENKYGDRKDICLLMEKMLKFIRIKSRLILIRKRNYGEVTKDIPSISQFDSTCLLVNISDKDIFLFPGKYYFFGQIPSEYQGTVGFSIEDARFIDIPSLPCSFNKEKILDIININEDGSADCIRSISFLEQEAVSFREEFDCDKIEQELTVHERMSYSFPSSVIKDFRIYNLQDKDKIPQLKVFFKCPEYAIIEDRFMIFNLPFKVSQNIPEEKKSYPFYWEYPYTEEHIIRFKYPDIYNIEYKPIDIKLRNGRLIYKEKFSIIKSMLGPEYLGYIKKIFNQRNKAQKELILLKRK